MQMILDRVADDGEMSVFWWDMGSRLSVVDYWITCAHESGLLSLEDSLRIDSLVLHTEGLGHVDYRTHLIDVMPALPEYYPIVREAYVRDHNARVLPKLASYQKEEDIELIVFAHDHIAVARVRVQKNFIQLIHRAIRCYMAVVLCKNKWEDDCRIYDCHAKQQDAQYPQSFA